MQTVPVAIRQPSPLQATQVFYQDDATIWHHMSDALHQSLDRVLSMLIAILPGILAFIVALLVFTLLGLMLSALLRWALTAAKFDERIARNRPDPGWSPSASPTTLVRRSVFWGCILLGLLIGVSAFDTSFATAATLPISLLPYLTHAVGAIFCIAGQSDCTLPGAVSADWGSQCAASVRSFSFAWREVAGAGADRSDGAGTPGDWRRGG